MVQLDLQQVYRLLMKAQPIEISANKQKKLLLIRQLFSFIID